MQPTALVKQPANVMARVQMADPMGRILHAESPVIESPADQTWIAFCSTLVSPVMLLPDLEWIEG